MSYYHLKDPLIHDRISNDVSLLTRQLALIASDGINATLQLVFYATKIITYGMTMKTGQMAGMGPVLVGSPFLYCVAGMTAISSLTPNFAYLQKKQRELEGSYRLGQSKVQASAEAVALFGGHEYEKEELQGRYELLRVHVLKQIKNSWFFNVVKDFVVKYCQTTFMTVICLFPFVSGPKRSQAVGANTARAYCHIWTLLPYMDA